VDPLTPFREAPEASALLFDVDGTLAPIAPRPELARVPEATRTELRRLVGEYLLVACISGRAGGEAAELVGVEGIHYVGNHGLELMPESDALRKEIADFRDAVGLEVEDKGLSLSYHYRGAADEEAAKSRLQAVATRAREAGLDPRWGRKVLEVRPGAGADKGTAVEALLGEVPARLGLYAGDDTTDLDAFAGLERAALDHALRIAVGSEEGPGALAGEADLLVASPEELAGLLRSL
jgi:trehalose 6-phosphate phosphatase